MISLRYHAVSLAAVFLAVALGAVLGSTSLSGGLLSGLGSERAALGKQLADLKAQRNAQDARLLDADRFAATIGPMAVRGLLAQHSVVLVTTPNVAQSDRDALLGLLGDAGAMITGEVQLADAFTDPTRADQLRDLVTRLLPAGVQLPAASDPGTLAGSLLGALLLLGKDNQPQASGEESAAALSGLAGGGFVRPGRWPVPAQLAVVLTGGQAPSDAAADRSATIARFATQLDRRGFGAVLAGGSGSADGGGPLGVVRADPAADSILSTVDDADGGAGRVATVLALREQLNGRAGRYGTAGNAQAPAPQPGM
jgi:Copper transport outer membrane protein, MctB